jgi:hypothetical protein
VSIHDVIEEMDAIDRLAEELGIILPSVPTLEEEIDMEYPASEEYALDETFSVATRWRGVISDSR